MDASLRAGLVGRNRRRAAIGLGVASVLAAVVFVVGASQVPTTPTGYDNAGNALHPPPVLVSPVWIAGLALGSGLLAAAYAYWNGGLLVAIGIEAGALLPLAVFADYGVYRNGLSGLEGVFGQGAQTTLARSAAIALVAGTLAYALGNELRNRTSGRRGSPFRANSRLEPPFWAALVGDDPDLAGTQVAVGVALATLPLLAVLLVPYLPGQSGYDLAFAVVAVGLLPVALGGVVATRRAAVAVPLALTVPLGIQALHPYDSVWVPLLLFLVAVLATAEGARRHGALVPCLAAPAIPLFTLGVALQSPPISGCEWLGRGTGPFYCSTGPVELLTAGLTLAAVGIGIGLLGFLLGVSVRRPAPE